MKPKPTFNEYPEWAKATLGVAYEKSQQNLYEACLRGARDHASTLLRPLGETILTSVTEKYRRETGSELLMPTTLAEAFELHIKPFASAVDKSYRQNVNWNDNWDGPPDDGWVTPDNWLTRFNDTVRTSLICKYLDGPRFLALEIEAWAAENGIKCRFYSQQKEVGYCAYHVYLFPRVALLDVNWGDHEAELSVEIQLSTQLQEVMRALTHEHYEKDRISSHKTDEAWQWQHTSDVFRARYISHTLHLLEGIILELRDSRKGPQR